MSEDEEVLEFETADKTEKRNPPLFENEDHGLTAWVDKDRNGNYFLRLRLPLGLGTVPMFLNETAYEDIQKSFDKMVEHHLNERDQS